MDFNTQRDERLKQIHELGFMQFDGEQFVGKEDFIRDFNVHHTDIVCSTNQEWDKIIKELKTTYDKRKAEQ